MRGAELVGKRFTRLAVVEKVQRKPVKWKCICDCGEIRIIETSALLRKKSPRKSCGCLSKSDIEVLPGKVFSTNSSGDILIVGLVPRYKAIVRFFDGTEVVAATGNIRTGNVSNPCEKTAFGLGFFGIGPHRAHGTKSHAYWYKMMQRAYCPDYKKSHPTYDAVTVCEEWHNYQNFAEWCKGKKQYGKSGFNLDKDLIKPGNKIYCPEFCSLVPQAINKLTVRKSLKRDLPQGVTPSGLNFISRCNTMHGQNYIGTFSCKEAAGQAYRIFKKKAIIEAAEKYKDDLDEDVYQALINFEVQR